MPCQPETVETMASSSTRGTTTSLSHYIGRFNSTISVVLLLLSVLEWDISSRRPSILVHSFPVGMTTTTGAYENSRSCFTISKATIQSGLPKFAIPPLKTSALYMAPKFDKTTQQWTPTSPDEMPSAGYGKVKTLLLHGPTPFVQRLLQSDNYEQGVLKFMAGDQCSRDEAQGNMDAYLANPNDWAVNRMAAQKPGGYQPDYVTLRTNDILLTVAWTVVLSTYVGRAIYVFTTPGANFFPAFLTHTLMDSLP